MSQQCYQMATKPSLEAFPLVSLEVKKQGANPEPVDQVQKLHISGDKAIKSLITSFYGGKIQPMGVAELTIEFGDRETKDTKTIRSLFNIVDLPLTYSNIIGRSILYEIDAATSIR